MTVATEGDPDRPQLTGVGALALPDNEQHFRALVDDVLGYAIFGLDSDGVVTSWNAGAEHLQGYRPEEIIGQPSAVFYSQPDAVAGLPVADLARATEDGFVDVDGWRLRKDGSRFWANVVITALHDEQHALQGFGNVTRDITSRKYTEQVLRDSEERFRLLVDGVKDYAIFSLDVAGLVTSWNAGAERIKGYSRAEILGRHLSVFYSADDVAARLPERELETAAAVGRCEADGWRLRKDGTRFWANVVITALYNENHELRGFGKVTRDVTLMHEHLESMRAITQELDRTRLAALHALELQRAFTVAISHELRTPTASIIGYVEEVLDMAGLPPEASGFVKTVHRNALRLSQLIDDLFILSEAERGTYLSSAVPTDVDLVIDEEAVNLAATAQSAGVAIIIEHSAVPALALVDETRFSRALGNIISNAVTFTPAGGTVSVVSTREPTSASAQRASIQVTVTDTGSGIPEAELARVFDQFYRSRQAVDSEVKGRGLGLAIAKAIVEAQGGAITVESAVGRGTRVTITVPAAADSVGSG